MNVLLIGERYSNNLGDGVIYDVVETMVGNIFEDIKVICIDISGNNKYALNTNINKKTKIRNKYIHSKLSVIKRSLFLEKNLNQLDFDKIDLAIFVGGQLFSEYFSRQIYIIAKKLNKYNIPVLYNSCGIGVNKKNKKYLEKALCFNNVKAISLRDNYEYFINNYKYNGICVESMDPVFELSKFYPKKNKLSNKIGIGLMEPNAYLHNNISLSRDRYFELIDNIIRNIEKNDKDWELFCNGNTDDYKFIIEFCNQKGYSLEKIAKRPVVPDELIDTIINYKKIVSFRLHSHIIASSYDIPILGFEWDKKVYEYFCKINNQDFCLELNENIFDILDKKVDEFLKVDVINNKYEVKNSKIELSSEFLKKNMFK
ncbi:polysaccharide pyruvyl transferase CsaB [Turicibacter sanguinis]|nr:polysaccharide pyruvyl transferase CsaB [Turicibacter sanguinis]